MNMKQLNGIVCIEAKKQGLPPLLVKSVCFCESSYAERAYRYEPAFWKKYLAENPEWKDKDPAVVSASYGLMQLMWTTAWSMGFRGTQDDLWNPQKNVELGTRLLKMLIDKVFEKVNLRQCAWLSPGDIALARYNGGRWKNPDEFGELRNLKYVTRVRAKWEELKKAGDNPCVQA